jgi:hypothetical protein
MNEYINDILEFKISKYSSTSTQSTNSQRKHLKQIFSLILEENLKYRNQYGYSEIHFKKFKSIDKRHYKKLLYWLEENDLIKIRKSYVWNNEEKFLEIHEPHCGGQSFQKKENDVWIKCGVETDPFFKGYKINDELLEQSGILLTDIDCYSRSVIDIFKYSNPNPIHSIITKGYSSLIDNKNTNLTNSQSIITKGYSSQQENGTRICGDSSQRATVNTYPSWTFETSWTPLTIIDTDELTKKEMRDYKKGLYSKYNFKEGRFYGGFHFINKDHIQYLRLFNEEIQEWGDGTAFFTKLIGKLIEDVEDIPYQEKYNFQQFAINDPYIHLMKKLNLNNREDAKKLLNVYVNSINQSASKMYDIDNYFQTKFPNIRTWLRSIPTVREKTYDKSTKKYKMKTKKQLWKLNQNMEYQIMKKLCIAINKEFGVYPITKHDAIYLRKSDIESLKNKNIKFESEMKKALSFEFYNDLIFEL